VPKAGVELGVAVVGNAKQTILDAEGVAEVIAHFVMSDLNFPAVEILAVENRLPLLPGGGEEQVGQ
jgi:hypothetical protein